MTESTEKRYYPLSDKLLDDLKEVMVIPSSVVKIVITIEVNRLVMVQLTHILSELNYESR